MVLKCELVFNCCSYFVGLWLNRLVIVLELIRKNMLVIVVVKIKLMI